MYVCMYVRGWVCGCVCWTLLDGSLPSNLVE